MKQLELFVLDHNTFTRPIEYSLVWPNGNSEEIFKVKEGNQKELDGEKVREAHAEQKFISSKHANRVR